MPELGDSFVDHYILPRVIQCQALLLESMYESVYLV